MTDQKAKETEPVETQIVGRFQSGRKMSSPYWDISPTGNPIWVLQPNGKPVLENPILVFPRQ